MKIAIISDAIYPYNIGGKEKRIFEVSTRLAKKGHDVHIYTMKWWSGNNTQIENGVHLHAVCRYFPLYKNGTRSIIQALAFGVSCIRLLTEDFEVCEVDHMPHFHLFSMKLVCMIKRKKMIVCWNEVWDKKYWKDYAGIKGNVGFLIEQLTMLLPTKIISNSPDTTRKLQRELRISIPISTIPPGVDMKRIKKIKKSSKHSTVIFAGRLLSHKHVDVLIQAFKKLSKQSQKLSCTIVGEGPEKPALVKLCKELQLSDRITFHDFFTNEDNLYSLMKSTSIFVLPSTREGFGIVAIEANACGIPVITTRHQDNATSSLIVPGKTGLLSDGTSAGLTAAIEQLIHHPLRAIDCQKFAALYDWDTIVRKTEEVYSE